MEKLTALMTVYNEPIFTKACLESIEPVVDEIVIIEGSWLGDSSTYDYGTNKPSDDGTRQIVEEFCSKYPKKTQLLDSALDEATCRNMGLSVANNDWILHLDCDEFYDTEKLKIYKDILGSNEHPKFGPNRFPNFIFGVNEKSFYLNFKYYTTGFRYRLFNRNYCHYGSGNGVGDILRTNENKDAPRIDLQDIDMFHFQWVGNRHKVISSPNIERQQEMIRRLDKDPNDEQERLGTWHWWINDICMKFDGTNYEELIKKNGGSIHPWSLRHDDCRPEVHVVDENFKWPSYLYNYDWFQPEEKGFIDFTDRKK
jgi:glycosyltransferase involved in cell wall biosynthesis